MEAVKSVLEKLHVGSSAEKAAAPREPTEEQLKTLQEKYEKAEQGHVFAFYDTLSSAEKSDLYDQLAGIDPERVNEFTKRALSPAKGAADEQKSGLEPLPDSATASILDSETEDIEKWYNVGLDLISKNRVAVLLLAGGQGTRLGSSAPKGCYDIGLPSKKSLFQIQAERIRKVQSLAEKIGGKDSVKVVLPWYVMTSGPTRGPTEAYFEEHDYFGLEKENVIVFEQGVLPCISNDGKILMETKSKV